jgi:hypothetical protein
LTGLHLSRVSGGGDEVEGGGALTFCPVFFKILYIEEL